MTATATSSAPVATPPGAFTSLRRVRPVYPVAAETALAAVLMSYRLGRQSLWFDEATIAASVHLGLKSAVRYAVVSEPVNGLYSMVMWVWGAAFGDGEVALRTFSVLAGIALVPVTYALARRLFSVRTALVAGLLTAVSTTVVAVAQQARQYALVLLLVALATLCFVHAVEGGTQQSWLLYGLVAALAVYANAFAVLVITAHALSLLALRQSDVQWHSVWVAAAGFALAVIPLFAAIVRRGGSSQAWIEPTTLAGVRDTFEMLASGTGLLLLAALVASGFALRATFRVWTRSGRGIEAWRYTLLFTWLFVPVIGLLLISVVRPAFVSRYMIGALSALVILIAVGITAMRPWQMGGGFLVALVALNAVVLASWLGSDSATARAGVGREDWRGVAAYVLARSRRSDAVVLQQGYLTPTWTYYLDRQGSPQKAPRLLSDFSWHAPLEERTVRAISPRRAHVWLVMAHLDRAQRRTVRERFGERYDLATTARFTGMIEVLRYDART